MKKTTGTMGNVPEILRAVERKCSGLHKHGALMGGGKPRQAQEYTPQFVNAILRGLRQALRRDGSLSQPRGGVPPTWLEEYEPSIECNGLKAGETVRDIFL